MTHLVVDPALRPAWDRTAPAGARLLGLAAAVTAGRRAAVVVADRPLTEAEGAELAAGMAADADGAEAGLRVELAVLAVPGLTAGPADLEHLADLVRQWVNQAAQGSGRGVSVQVDAAPGDGPVRVLVRSIDSSARELAFRLASTYEPALPALRELLGRPVTVHDVETAG